MKTADTVGLERTGKTKQKQTKKQRWQIKVPHSVLVVFQVTAAPFSPALCWLQALGTCSNKTCVCVSHNTLATIYTMYCAATKIILLKLGKVMPPPSQSELSGLAHQHWVGLYTGQKPYTTWINRWNETVTWRIYSKKGHIEWDRWWSCETDTGPGPVFPSEFKQQSGLNAGSVERSSPVQYVIVGFGPIWVSSIAVHGFDHAPAWSWYGTASGCNVLKSVTHTNYH